MLVSLERSLAGLTLTGPSRAGLCVSSAVGGGLGPGADLGGEGARRGRSAAGGGASSAAASTSAPAPAPAPSWPFLALASALASRPRPDVAAAAVGGGAGGGVSGGVGDRVGDGASSSLGPVGNVVGSSPLRALGGVASSSGSSSPSRLGRPPLPPSWRPRARAPLARPPESYRGKGNAVNCDFSGVEAFRHHARDTGSVEVQVARLTARLGQLSRHLELHWHDVHGRRGRDLMLARRARLLKYLRRADPDAFVRVARELRLSAPPLRDSYGKTPRPRARLAPPPALPPTPRDRRRARGRRTGPKLAIPVLGGGDDVQEAQRRAMELLRGPDKAKAREEHERELERKRQAYREDRERELAQLRKKLT